MFGPRTSSAVDAPVRRAAFYSGRAGEQVRYFNDPGRPGLYFGIDSVKEVKNTRDADGHVGFLNAAEELSARVPAVSEIKVSLRADFVDANLAGFGMAVVTAKEVPSPPKDLVHVGRGIFVPQKALR